MVLLTVSECHSDGQPHWVSALIWPRYNTIQETDQVTMDSLLIGRLNGSVGVIEVTDGYIFARCELEHCSRKNGMKIKWLKWHETAIVLTQTGMNIK